MDDALNQVGVEGSATNLIAGNFSDQDMDPAMFLTEMFPTL